jgi:hypothetical protein
MKRMQLVIAALMVLGLTACATVAPVPVKTTATTASVVTQSPAQIAAQKAAIAAAQQKALVINWYNTCTAYKASLSAVTTFGEDGFLPNSAILPINTMNEQLAPLCPPAAPPANISVITQKLTQGIVTLGTDEMLAVAMMKKQGAIK